MRSIFIIPIILFLFTACAAQPAAPTAGVTTTLAPTSTSLVPTETPTASATPSPESLLPQEVREKFKQAGIDLKDMTNAKYDKNGLHITLESGEVIVLNNAALENNIYLGQDNVLQYRDESNQNVIYAFDKESQTFLEASKYIQKDKTDPEKYIQVKDWDELFALWAKEKMFLIPFDPNNTYFPPSDKIYRGYTDWKNNQGVMDDEGFGFKYPFGQLPEGMVSPFRFVNLTRVQAGGLEKQSSFIVVSEQVFNPDDDSFSVLHFYAPDYEGTPSALEQGLHEGGFFVPTHKLYSEQLGLLDDPYWISFVKYYEINNITIEKDGRIPVIEELVNRWFDERHVPYELERTVTKGHGLLITGDYNY